MNQGDQSLVWIGLAVTPVIISCGQILFKLTGDRSAGAAGGLWSILSDPLFIAALALYGIGTLVWISVLRSVPLTYAYPFLALTFIVVPLLASVILNEPLTGRYWAGVWLIVSGMLVINL